MDISWTFPDRRMWGITHFTGVFEDVLDCCDSFQGHKRCQIVIFPTMAITQGFLSENLVFIILSQGRCQYFRLFSPALSIIVSRRKAVSIEVACAVLSVHAQMLRDGTMRGTNHNIMWRIP